MYVSYRQYQIILLLNGNIFIILIFAVVLVFIYSVHCVFRSVSPIFFPSNFLRQGLSQNLELDISSRLASQRGAFHPDFYVGARESNLGHSLAQMANAVTDNNSPDSCCLSVFYKYVLQSLAFQAAGLHGLVNFR